MCKRVNRGRAVDQTVRHRVALEGHPPNLFVCVKTILEYYSTFFPGKVLGAAIFHIFEFSSSSCLFGFGRFRCALVFFNTDFVCVTERERVYVSICVLWRKGNVEMVCV